MLLFWEKFGKIKIQVSLTFCNLYLFRNQKPPLILCIKQHLISNNLLKIVKVSLKEFSSIIMSRIVRLIGSKFLFQALALINSMRMHSLPHFKISLFICFAIHFISIECSCVAEKVNKDKVEIDLWIG